MRFLRLPLLLSIGTVVLMFSTVPTSSASAATSITKFDNQILTAIYSCSNGACSFASGKFADIPCRSLDKVAFAALAAVRAKDIGYDGSQINTSVESVECEYQGTIAGKPVQFEIVIFGAYYPSTSAPSHCSGGAVCTKVPGIGKTAIEDRVGAFDVTETNKWSFTIYPPYVLDEANPTIYKWTLAKALPLLKAVSKAVA